MVAASWEYWRNVFDDDLKSRGLDVILEEAEKEQAGRPALTVDKVVDYRQIRELR